MSRLLTLLIGLSFLFFAALGLMPGGTIGRKLHELFSGNFFNQIFYLAMGSIALLCWLKGERAPLKFLWGGGFLLTVLGIAGFVSTDSRLFYLFTTHFSDNLLHLILGLFMLYLALIFYKK